MKEMLKRQLALLLILILTAASLPVEALAAQTATKNKSVTSSQLVQTLNGWKQRGSNRYYYKNGEMLEGWAVISNSWYYFSDPGGQMQTGWVLVDGSWYYLDSNGRMQTGWIEDNGYWYYLTSNGPMKTGWLQDGNYWYYLNRYGVMQTGWLQSGTDWYYLSSYGAMQTGWLQSGTTWYYLKSSGVMARNETLSIGGKTYAFSSGGAMKTGTSASSSSETNSYTVYVSRNGKIHKRSNCSGMKYYTEMSYSSAKAAGYVECKNCYH